MKYAVEARIFDNGKIVTKVRQAEEGEISLVIMYKQLVIKLNERV